MIGVDPLKLRITKIYFHPHRNYYPAFVKKALGDDESEKISV